MTEHAALDAGMAQLAARFITRLPERQARLQSSWEAWQAAANNAPPPELIREIHSLAGAALLFGHEALGTQARTLENTLLQTSGPASAQREAIENLFAAIAALTRAAA